MHEHFTLPAVILSLKATAGKQSRHGSFLLGIKHDNDTKDKSAARKQAPQ
jgi:hypothetical protein